jgi:hypothetical protein
MLFSHTQGRIVLIAIFISWLIASFLLVLSPLLMKTLGKNGLIAIERVMGMILILLAIQRFMEGITLFTLWKRVVWVRQLDSFQSFQDRKSMLRCKIPSLANYQQFQVEIPVDQIYIIHTSTNQGVVLPVRLFVSIALYRPNDFISRILANPI